jgi:hypothetical protein
MARAKSTGNGRLEESLAALHHAQATLMQSTATLIQNQAAFAARAAEVDARMAEMKRENDERFPRIEALLLEHSRILKALPDAIREKIGFKAPGS